jgi:hypothetical protein
MRQSFRRTESSLKRQPDLKKSDSLQSKNEPPDRDNNSMHLAEKLYVYTLI